MDREQTRDWLLGAAWDRLQKATDQILAPDAMFAFYLESEAQEKFCEYYDVDMLQLPGKPESGSDEELRAWGNLFMALGLLGRLLSQADPEARYLVTKLTEVRETVLGFLWAVRFLFDKWEVTPEQMSGR